MKKASKKKQRIKDKRNLNRKLKRNLRRKAKEKFNTKREEKDIMGNHYKKGLKILRDLVRRAEFDGFMFAYEPGLEGGPSILTSNKKGRAPYELMISHIGTAVASIVKGCSNGNEQEMFKMVTDTVIELAKNNLSREMRFDEI